jgi:ribosome-associated protein
MPDDLILINDQVAIPFGELAFRYARSSGPGGQHVQRTETKVELLFDLAGSPSLNETQRRLAMGRLGSRLDQQGVLHLVSQASRSQLENRADVIDRFQRLLAAALRPPKPRRATRPTAAARQQRLEGKRRRGQAKRMRGRVGPEE